MSSLLDQKLKLYEAQSILFASKLSRLRLQDLNLNIEGSRHFRMNVWRNHSIETIISLCLPYFDYASLKADFSLSDYDDSLMFSDYKASDIELLWLDSSRYLGNISCDDWFDWIIDRVWKLREFTTAPIIIATWLPDGKTTESFTNIVKSLASVYFADLASVCVNTNLHLIDDRTASVAGTRIGNAAQILIARKLACHWIPSVILPPIKAVALDLDQTLHEGILGEEGFKGVQLKPSHEHLQLFLKSLQQRGIFLALISRNELADVKALFLQRPDYPIKWDDFSAIEVSWNDKSKAIQRIFEALRIAPDALLFVDDNIGELIEVTATFPEVHTVYASSNPLLTQQTIEYYPGLWRWKVEVDDGIRLQDLEANSKRENLLSQARSITEYFRSLQVSLIYQRNPLDQLSRLADLCNKTNQFNLALRRFNQVEIEEYIRSNNTSIVSVQLTDKLSSSGVIAVLIARHKDQQLLLEELCISCRALGRKLESSIVFGAIQEIELFWNCRDVIFSVNHGLRNQPALDWLKQQLGMDPTMSLQPGFIHYLLKR